jgi:hypothetical protein
MVFSKLSGAFRGFASKVLAMDTTATPRDQMVILREMLSNYRFDLDSKDLLDTLESLKKKHLVDSIIVTQKDGSIVATSEKNGLKTAITGTALFNYVNSELTKTESILIKSDGAWFMVFPFKENVFVVKASAHLNTIELRALAVELDGLLKKIIQTASNKPF